jgi:hypothetical protein
VGQTIDFCRLSLVPETRQATNDDDLPHGRCDRIVPMPKFVIERDIPEAGKLSPQQLQAISQKSCGVLREMGPRIQWVQSYVTDDKIYCVYVAPDEDAVRRHAQQGGFPANRISQIRSVIDPTTAE